MPRKLLVEKIAFASLRLVSLGVLGVLLWLLGFIFTKGIGSLSWTFLTSAPSDAMSGGGIFPAIVGTLLLTLLSIGMAFPVGLMAGIYLHEYAKDGWLKSFIALMTNNLAGVPSIVFGLFGMSLFVVWFGFGDSILAGALTLGIMVLPIIIRTSEESLKGVTKELRQASIALGATKLYTIWHVVLPVAMPRILTGLILAVGRVAGETAPILFTVAAFYLPRLPHSVFDQVMALPYHLYVISTSGANLQATRAKAYGTALVLLLLVLMLNLAANLLRRYYNRKLGL